MRRNLNVLVPKSPGAPEIYQSEKLIPVGAGGSIVVGRPAIGRSSICFQPGDVPSDLNVRVQWDPHGAIHGGVEFSPHGAHFKAPVQVRVSYATMDLDRVDEDKIRLWYYNEEEDVWELVGGKVDKANKQVVATIGHFSRYALAAE